jgi:DNA modification methylase
MTWEILEGDCREWMADLPENSVDSIVTDPPYGLSFMGKGWDHGVPGVEFWMAALRVAKPGAYLLAFGGTRTHHRLMVAIEDAGWEIRDTIMWVYGSGFPKSHNGPWGGTALKPAWEPIILARKPLIPLTVAANVQKFGTGGLNIDGCRIETSTKDQTYIMERVGGFNNTQSIGGNGKYSGGEIMDRAESYDAAKGRWPANLIHDGSDEVLAAFPDSKGQQGDVRGTEPSHTGDENTNCYGEFARVPAPKRNDTGSAARFFYCAKASRSDRGADNNHATVKPTDLMRYLCRLITPPGGTVLDPFMGSGSTGKAALKEGFGFTGIELSPDYCDIAEARLAALKAAA